MWRFTFECVVKRAGSVCERLADRCNPDRNSIDASRSSLEMTGNSSNTRVPQCTILLATHNGERWLREQLSSIYNQVGVSIRVVANDDQSTDGTQVVLDRWAESHDLEQLPDSGKRLGNANKNFLCLIRDVDVASADYVALADQDDVWHPDKLAHAIDRLEATGADAYSSNVEAFWPDGRTRIVRKSHAQRAWDYLFSSPGPGCTFVLRRSTFLDLQSWVLENFEELSNLWVHDWTLYAYVRSAGRQWLIDEYVSLRYRQHGGNEIGANIGLAALRRRLARMRSGRYREDVLSISRLVGAPPRLLHALERMKLRDRLWLLCHVHQLRRGLKEAAAMALLIFLMK